MPVVRITNRFADRLRAPDPSGKQQLYWADGPAHPGLGILVSGVSATKSWVAQGKLKGGGGTRRITIGPVGVLSLEAAWEQAQVQLADLHAGKDPRKRRGVVTLCTALEAFLDGSPNLRPRSVALYRQRIGRNLKDWLNVPLASITAEMIEARFRAITEEVQARAAAGHVSGRNVDGRSTANDTLKALGTIWNHQSERNPELGRNPCWVLKRQWHRLERRTELVTSDQLPEFHSAVLALPSAIQRDLVRLVLFTGMRRNEAEALRWDEVDLASKVIRLPARRMKAKQPFTLPMSSWVHSLLVARRAVGIAGDFVFPGSGKEGFTQSFSEALRQVGATSGVKVSPHDLRRTFCTVAAECEISPHALKLLVAHSTGGDVTSGYIVMSPATLRQASQKIGDRIAALCGIDVKDLNVAALHAV